MVYYYDVCIHLHNYIQVHIQTHKKAPGPMYIQRLDGSPKQYMWKYYG